MKFTSTNKKKMFYTRRKLHMYLGPSELDESSPILLIEILEHMPEVLDVHRIGAHTPILCVPAQQVHIDVGLAAHKQLQFVPRQQVEQLDGDDLAQAPPDSFDL